MYIHDKELKNKLQTLGLPVYYERIVDSTVKMPCITYLPVNNSDYLVGDTLFYSNIDYYVKLWGTSKKELEPYIEPLNDLMRAQGFKRSSYHELPTGTQVVLVGLYKAIGFEHYQEVL